MTEITVNSSLMAADDPTTAGDILTYLNSISNPVYTNDITNRVVTSLVSRCREWGIRTAGAAGQMLDETNFLRFTGDVKSWQFNYGGIGATGDGAKGASFATPEEGVDAFLLHILTYALGSRLYWAKSAMDLQTGADYLDPRYASAMSAGHGGNATSYAYLAGTWAANKNYHYQIIEHANNILDIANLRGGTPIRKLRVAISAGHYYSQGEGGNPGANDRELQIVGNLTHAYVLEMNSFPSLIDFRCITPNQGRGVYPGGLDSVANNVNVWADQGWDADIFLEVHTQGVGDTSGRGLFGIYPDWGVDIDDEARDTLIPFIVEEMTSRTPLTRWSSGKMSEKSTGVGGSGYRLGVFRVTEPRRLATTRLIIEHGHHTNSTDYALLKDPAVQRNLAAGGVEGMLRFARHIGIQDAVAPPVAPEAPDEIEFAETNRAYKFGFLNRVRQLGEIAYPTLGIPTTHEHRIPWADHTEIVVQGTDRGVLSWYPDAKGPWDIRVLTPPEQYQALTAIIRKLEEIS